MPRKPSRPIPLCPTFLLYQSPGGPQDFQVIPHHLDSYILCISLNWSISPSFLDFQNPLTVPFRTHRGSLAKYTISSIVLLYTLFTFLAPMEISLSSTSALVPSFQMMALFLSAMSHMTKP